MTKPAMARLSRTVKESQHESSQIMMPGHANNLGPALAEGLLVRRGAQNLKCRFHSAHFREPAIPSTGESMRFILFVSGRGWKRQAFSYRV